MRELTIEAASQLPRLARLEQVQPSTRISLGLLVAERTRRAPDETFFLFEDRAYSAREVGERIDNIVRGLISIGVRQGEHVGVLMGPRPSALALVVALNRLGAVSVLLRPDGELAREAALGHVQRVIADPERAAQAAGLGTLHTFVLGGGGSRARPRSRADDRHGADRSAQRPTPQVVPAKPGAGGRSGVRHLHRARRGNADEPDHQPPLDHVGIRDGIVGRAIGRRHRLQRDAALSPVRADDERRRRDRRRRAAGDGDAL